MAAGADAVRRYVRTKQMSMNIIGRKKESLFSADYKHDFGYNIVPSMT